MRKVLIQDSSLAPQRVPCDIEADARSHSSLLSVRTQLGMLQVVSCIRAMFFAGQAATDTQQHESLLGELKLLDVDDPET